MTHEEVRILAPKNKVSHAFHNTRPHFDLFAFYSDLCSVFADALQKESEREREKALGSRSNAPSTPSGYLLTGEPGLGNIEFVYVCVFANLFFHRSNDPFKTICTCVCGRRFHKAALEASRPLLSISFL